MKQTSDASHTEQNMQLFGTAGLFVSLSLLIGIGSCHGAATGERYENQPIPQSLYNGGDRVAVLNVSNFKYTVYGSPRGWLVEFYYSWCGYCIRFAPTWKAFASDVYSWNDIVVIAAIDCANDDNNIICREHEIGHYPQLKYFSVDSPPSSHGTMIEKVDTVEALRYNLIERLVKEQQEGRVFFWPNINPYRNETTDVWKDIPNTVKYFFLIFEEEDSYLGAEVILDLHNISILQLRRVTSDNQIWIQTNKVTKFPSIIAFSRNESQRFLNISDSSREGIGKVITTFLTSKEEEIVIEKTQKPGPTSPKTVTFQELLPTEEETNNATREDHLYQLDLENALRYSIFHEIPLSKAIKGEKFEALQHYLSLLAGYFPFKHNNSVLEVTRDVVNGKEEITGKEFIHLVKSEEEKSSMFSGPPQWVGCKGSSQGFRGYPCGLWTLYHMLSVNFAMQNGGNTLIDRTEVLKTMHDYVKHFFGCADCAQHFLKMALKNKIFEARTVDETVLWLWKAHNEVNTRLAGDATEDPEHKKIQYPAAEHCPLCRHANDSWNEEHVLSYLKKKYSYAAIKYLGTEEIQQSNDSTRVTDCQDSLQYLLLGFVLLSMQYLLPCSSLYA